MDTGTSTVASVREPPALPGGLPLLGHMLAFAKNPYRFMKHVSDTLGEIAQFRIFSQRMVLLTGDEASQLFYRGSDEQLDQSAAYKLMTPIFGKGIIFDAPNDIKNQQLKMLMPSLRMEAMRHHADKILEEVRLMMQAWGAGGDLEVVSAMKQLTINTASHCLLGREFRFELTDEFAGIYHDLEGGVNALAYSFPNLPIPAFRRRDKARKRLEHLVGEIVRKRQHQADKPQDMFQTLIDTRYADGTPLNTNEITGMLIGAIFAGHHTSSGTAAWVLVELLRHPEWLKKVRKEIMDVIGEDGEITFNNLRELHSLESVIKEVLRLHPPLIVLMRQVSEPMVFKGIEIRKGDMVWASPPVTHRMAHLFPDPERFDPERYSAERGEDKNLMAFQPFGGGKHKCSGNAFALFQLKAIFAEILRRYDFYLSQPAESYEDDYTEMIVQPRSPCKVRYTRRMRVVPDAPAVHAASPSGAASAGSGNPPPGCPFHQAGAGAATKKLVISIDTGLCQGHAMCMGEAPDTFHVTEGGQAKVLQIPSSPEAILRAHNAAKHCPNQAIRLTFE
jgi:sterol 14-demethylase